MNNLRFLLSPPDALLAWDRAEEIIGLMKIDDEKTLLDITHVKEIYPGSKKTHFAKFTRDTAIPYNEMLFFDDESRNIHEVWRDAYCLL